MHTKFLFYLFLQFMLNHTNSQELLLNNLNEKIFTNSLLYDSASASSNFIRPNRIELIDFNRLDSSQLILITQKSLFKSKNIKLSYNNIYFGLQENHSLNSYNYDGRYLSEKGLQSLSNLTFNVTFFNHISIVFSPTYKILKSDSVLLGYNFYPHDAKNSYNYYYKNRIKDEFAIPSIGSNFNMGQTSLSFVMKKISFGLNRSNLWLGPGEVNSILMTNNAPGIPRLEFRSIAPIKLPLFNFEFFIFNGTMKERYLTIYDSILTSNTVSSEKKINNSLRSINTNLIVLSPRFIEGLNIGINRTRYYMSKKSNDLLTGLNKLFFIDNLFKDGYGSNLDSTDQLLSLYTQFYSKSSGFKMYSEFSRNDHSLNFRDLLMEPNHSAAFIFGVQKIFKFKTHNKFKSFLFGFEYTNLSLPLTRILRAAPSFYTHFQIKEGYTFLNKYIGSNIGSASLSNDMYVRLMSNKLLLELSYSFIEKNRDLYIQLNPYFNYYNNWYEQRLSIELVKMSTKYDLSFLSNFVYVKNYFWLNNFESNTLFSIHNKIKINSISPNIRLYLYVKLDALGSKKKY